MVHALSPCGKGRGGRAQLGERGKDNNRQNVAQRSSSYSRRPRNDKVGLRIFLQPAFFNILSERDQKRGGLFCCRSTLKKPCSNCSLIVISCSYCNRHAQYVRPLLTYCASIAAHIVRPMLHIVRPLLTYCASIAHILCVH